MTTVQAENMARRKLTLLQLAQEIGNVSKACKVVGYSLEPFYEIRRNFHFYGAEGLLDELSGPRGPHTRTESTSRWRRRPWSIAWSIRRTAPSGWPTSFC